MLFSNDQVAEAINQWFEPAWMSVRPVPIVRIDFGDGHVVTRTLHGNIATYVCDFQGRVLDVLPGIYEPDTYLDRLNQLALLHQWLLEDGTDGTAEKYRSYHAKSLERLQRGQAAPRLVRNLDISKRAVIEQPVVRLLEADDVPQGLVAPPPGLNAPASLDDALRIDTQGNERVRRVQIHGYLVDRFGTTPGQMMRWLYRDVLHADLDDPYLGLRDLLFAGYPFDDGSARLSAGDEQTGVPGG